MRPSPARCGVISWLLRQYINVSIVRVEKPKKRRTSWERRTLAAEDNCRHDYRFTREEIEEMAVGFRIPALVSIGGNKFTYEEIILLSYIDWVRRELYRMLERTFIVMKVRYQELWITSSALWYAIGFTCFIQIWILLFGGFLFTLQLSTPNVAVTLLHLMPSILLTQKQWSGFGL